jgi:hypothetical protein
MLFARLLETCRPFDLDLREEITSQFIEAEAQKVYPIIATTLIVASYAKT